MSTWPNRGASGGPCGGLIERKLNSQNPSGHLGLTQANRPPRKPVRFSQPAGKKKPLTLRVRGQCVERS